jgi:N-acetylglucosaminyldiphosphoundecaprenol N-acetyl-beta-D-mannosaminyltransferase
MESLRTDEVHSQAGAMRRNVVESLGGKSVHESPVLHAMRHPVLGVPIDFVSERTVLTTIEHWRRNRTTGYICVVNPWSIAMSFCDERMRAALMGSSTSVPDGVGVTLAARILKYGRCGRVPGPDLMLSICDLAREYGYRHFFYGGREGVAAGLAKRLQNALPGLRVVGAYCPPFRDLTEEETNAEIDRINRAEPDILWVGLGAPKQEKWMAEHWRQTRVTALIGVGAAFDFHSGSVKRAPIWMRKLSCEWLWRLAQEPRRLWPKNVLNPLFIAAVLAQRVAMGYGEKEGRTRPATQP